MSLRLLLLASFAFLPFVSRAQQPENYPLRKLLLAQSAEKLSAIPADAGGTASVFAEELAAFNDPAFAQQIAPFLGQPISIDLANRILPIINTYARSHDLLVNVSLPQTQDISSGVLRMIVAVGRYGDIVFQGNRWFSRKLLQERLGIKPGDEIRLSTLEEAVNWVNTNPFRAVKVLVNENTKEPGKANLLVGVQEAPPFRVVFSAEDSGNALIGEQRYTGSIQFGNLWGRDHLGSYLYQTTSDPKKVQVHAIDYRIPLATRHFIQMNGSYSHSDVTFGNNNEFHAVSSTTSADVRYTVPLRTGDSPREVFFGANFKRANSTLSFDVSATGTPNFIPVRATATDAFHLLAGISSVTRSKGGAWVFAATVFASPGNVTPHNTDDAFQGNFDVDSGIIHTERSGARASYVYGNAIVQRLQPLSHGWELLARGFVQLTSHNLIGGQQLSIGGSNTVRGYEENAFSGDDGYIINHDLMSPKLNWKPSFLRRAPTPLENRLLGFIDIARVRYHHRFASDINLGSLASAGLGFRSTLGANFNFSFDYGWQLLHVPLQPGQGTVPPLHSRAHIKLVLAF